MYAGLVKLMGKRSGFIAVQVRGAFQLAFGFCDLSLTLAHFSWANRSCFW
jgi:hypothetical protein